MVKLSIYATVVVTAALVSASTQAAEGNKFCGNFPDFEWNTITCVMAKDYFDNIESYEAALQKCQ